MNKSLNNREKSEKFEESAYKTRIDIPTNACYYNYAQGLAGALKYLNTL